MFSLPVYMLLRCRDVTVNTLVHLQLRCCSGCVINTKKKEQRDPLISKKQFLDTFRSSVRAGVLSRAEASSFIDACVEDVADGNQVTRGDLLRYVTVELQTNGVALDVDMYNTILDKYNTHRLYFNPKNFILSMHPVEANNDTNNHVLVKYAIQGDVKAAIHYIKLIKSSGASSQTAVGWLAHAFVKRGDAPSARSILTSAKKESRTHDHRLCYPLLYAYAEVGDVQSLEDTHHEMMESDSVPLTPYYVGILNSLAFGKHTDLVGSVLWKLNCRLSAGDFEHLTRLCIVRGDYNAARIFLSQINRKEAIDFDMYDEYINQGIS